MMQMLSTIFLIGFVTFAFISWVVWAFWITGTRKKPNFFAPTFHMWSHTVPPSKKPLSTNAHAGRSGLLSGRTLAPSYASLV